ncbi:MAG: DUF5671 domain-containing protein [bacterium]|nr:DUF5671 domain-containing protein [bacterium]
MADQTSNARRLFFYIGSLVSLGFIVGSGIYLLSYVVKVTVFQKADISYRGTPPAIFFNPTRDGGDIPDTIVSCTPTCSLTDSQRTSISDWQDNYRIWQQQPTSSTNRARGLVNALSFLIVALPVFWFLFRAAQRDAKQDIAENSDPKRSGRTVRSLYFYFIALAAVIMFMIFTGVTVNTVLKTWVVKSASDTQTNVFSAPVKFPGVTGTTDTTAITSLQQCADPCKLTVDQKAQLTQWQADYAQAKTEMDQQPKYEWQRTLATSIPFLLASIPLFLLHWLTIQRERARTTRSSQ